VRLSTHARHAPVTSLSLDCALLTIEPEPDSAAGVAEYNRTNTAMEELLGVHETAQYSGEGTYFNTTVFWVRQDLPYVAMLDTVDLKPTTREHFTEQVRPSQGM